MTEEDTKRVMGGKGEPHLSSVVPKRFLLLFCEMFSWIGLQN